MNKFEWATVFGAAGLLWVVTVQQNSFGINDGKLTVAPPVRAKPLSGKLAGHYRIRTGDYRLQFSVEVTTVRAADDEEMKEFTVLIAKAGHRDRFYGD